MTLPIITCLSFTSRPESLQNSNWETSSFKNARLRGLGGAFFLLTMLMGEEDGCVLLSNQTDFCYMNLTSQVTVNFKDLHNYYCCIFLNSVYTPTSAPIPSKRHFPWSHLYTAVLRNILQWPGLIVFWFLKPISFLTPFNLPLRSFTSLNYNLPYLPTSVLSLQPFPMKGNDCPTDS